MANPDITLCVATFLSQLERERSRPAINGILQSAILSEEALRCMFAQDRQNPLLLDPYIGLFKVFSIPDHLRRMRPRSPDVGIERVGIQSPNLSQRPEFLPAQYLFPLKREMIGYSGQQCTVASVHEFRENWEIFTHGALKEVRNWHNMIAAGGSVLACLLPSTTPNRTKTELNAWFQSDAYKGSDIDIFLWGLTAAQAKVKMQEIYLAVKQAVVWPVTCVRKAHTITIHTTYPNRPIQIVLRLYLSPAEVLAGFDVDSACCLYDGNDVYMNARAFVATIRQANTIDPSRRSPSYEIRLAKYATRGFEIYYPLLDRRRINYESLYSHDLNEYPKGLALLIVLEHISRDPFSYQLYQTRTRSPLTSRQPNPMNFLPIERRMLKNNYDASWLRIPYGPTWNADRIDQLVRTIDARMNSRYNPHMASRRLHRHLAVSGPMNFCLFTLCCTDCPLPTTDAENEMIANESSKYIRGFVSFITDNPGRQMTGSFNPRDDGDWCAGAYLEEGALAQNVHVLSPSYNLDTDEEGWRPWNDLLEAGETISS